MTEPEPDEEIQREFKNAQRKQRLKKPLLGCLISLGTLVLAFFFIVEICARH